MTKRFGNQGLSSRVIETGIIYPVHDHLPHSHPFSAYAYGFVASDLIFAQLSNNPSVKKHLLSAYYGMQ